MPFIQDIKRYQARRKAILSVQLTIESAGRLRDGSTAVIYWVTTVFQYSTRQNAIVTRYHFCLPVLCLALFYLVLGKSSSEKQG